MNIDMYGEKVAAASALIREFAKTEYYHYFAINMEASLEVFIAMMDSCREEGRVKGRAEALAELQPQWLAEKERADKAEERIAELEAQVAELSAKTVGWISVEQELPRNGQGVLFIVDAGGVESRKYLHGRVLGGEYNSKSGLFCTLGFGALASHWQLAPAAPSVVEGE